MAETFWKLEEDSSFKTEVKCTKILYHSYLNVILVITKNGEILVFDATSGVLLHKSILSGKLSLLIVQNLRMDFGYIYTFRYWKTLN